jgi:hypothetical protein
MTYASYRTYLYSTDGITWTTGNIPYTDKISGMAYGNGKFVAVNGNSGILSSNDGISWERNYTAIPSGNYSKVVFGNNRFVAKDVSKANVAYSDDGITWTLSATNYDVHNEVLYCRDRFMIFYNNNTVDYSYDGITWTLINIPSLDTYKSWMPAYGSDKFIAIGRNTNIAIYSDDGINWKKAPLPLSAEWSHIAYGNNKFIAIGNRLLTPICSYDGIHWKTTDVYITQGSQDKTTNIKELLLDGYATEEYVDNAMAEVDINGVVRYDELQDLTDEQKTQARTNIGIPEKLATENMVNTAVSQKSQVQIITWEADD